MKKPLPPVYFLLALLLIGVLHFVLPAVTLISGRWRCIGLLPLLLGVALIIVAERTFKQHGTTVKPFEESNALVTDGVFGLSRNPMYLGMVLILIGVALLAGSATPWIAVLLFAGIMDRAFIGPEEHMLENRFGEMFIEYKHRVRRWL